MRREGDGKSCECKNCISLQWNTCILSTIFLQRRYGEEYEKAHGSEIDWKSQEVDLDAAYLAGDGLPHGRYM